MFENVISCFKTEMDMKRFMLFFVYVAERIDSMTEEIAKEQEKEKISMLIMSQLFSLICFIKIHKEIIKDLIDKNVLPEKQVEVFKEIIESQMDRK